MGVYDISNELGTPGRTKAGTPKSALAKQKKTAVTSKTKKPSGRK